MKKIPTIAALFLVCYSCQNESTAYIPIEPVDLSNCHELSCKEIPTDDYWPSYPTGMFITDGNLLIKDERGYNQLLHIVTTEGELLQEFLHRGEGPQEFVATNFNAQFCDKGVLDVFDTAREKLLSYVQDSSGFVFSKVFQAQTRNGNIREMVNAGSYYLAMGENRQFEENRFAVLDTLGKAVRTLGSYPAIQPDLLTDAEADLRTILFHTSFFRTSPDKQKAVFASYKGALIQFFDLSALPDTLPTRTIQLERPKKKEQISPDHEGWVYGFEDVYTTNTHVYAIYNGETAQENPELGRHILKYDWQGNLLATYKADMGLRSLAVNEKNDSIFLVGYIDDELKLFAGQLTNGN